MSEPARYVDWLGGERDQALSTPRVFFHELNLRYRFTLDGAAAEGNALLPRYSSVVRPVPWLGERVFCNPPWSSIPPFIEQAPDADLAVLLVPARTNAKWFHRALVLGGKPDFFLGKLKFGNARWNSPVDCLLLVFGDA